MAPESVEAKLVDLVAVSVPGVEPACSGGEVDEVCAGDGRLREERAAFRVDPVDVIPCSHRELGARRRDPHRRRVPARCCEAHGRGDLDRSRINANDRGVGRDPDAAAGAEDCRAAAAAVGSGADDRNNLARRRVEPDPGSPLARASTRPSDGSMRITVPSPKSLTHTAVGPTPTAASSLDGAWIDTERPELRSTRATLSLLSAPPTQREPKPTPSPSSPG
jgi:hypothetical protein